MPVQAPARSRLVFGCQDRQIRPLFRLNRYSTDQVRIGGTGGVDNRQLRNAGSRQEIRFQKRIAVQRRPFQAAGRVTWFSAVWLLGIHS